MGTERFDTRSYTFIYPILILLMVFILGSRWSGLYASMYAFSRHGSTYLHTTYLSRMSSDKLYW